jgi:cytosine/adenosine deaminase-related metal-dependent hydrolase
MRIRAVLAIASLAVAPACTSAPPPLSHDAGSDDALITDAAVVDAFAADTFVGDAWRGDAGRPVITTSAPAPPAEVLQMGTAGLLLRGTVLTPTGPLSPGEVLVMGNTLACVAADCSTSPGASTATIIDTHATISPGLIDAHNHLTYDFLPEWVPPQHYQNRYQWANDASYMAWIAPYADHRSAADHVCPSTKWGELRSIIHGTTTVQGESPQQSCADRLARNADHYNGLGTDTMQTSIGSVRDLTDTGTTTPNRTTLTTAFTSGATTRFVVHMQEGYAQDNVTLEFESYAGRDTRTISLFAPAGGMPYGTGVFIHSLALTAAQIGEAFAQHARIVWSPSSNMALYGRTADIGALLAGGLTIGLGPDWTPSGEDEMLSEMRYAQAYGASQSISALTAERLWRMATVDGADVVGLTPIGTLVVGQRADIAVFGRTNATDPYQAVIDSRADDVRLVLIDGVGYYGDTNLQAATAVNTSCEAFDACGTAKYLCAANTPGSMTATSRYAETVADIHEQLRVIMAGYNRESDLLELVDCSR